MSHCLLISPKLLEGRAEEESCGMLSAGQDMVVTPMDSQGSVFSYHPVAVKTPCNL